MIDPQASNTSASEVPPPISRVLETALYVGDLDVSETFYRELFGFERLLRDERMCGLAIPGRQVLLLFRRGGNVFGSATGRFSGSER